MDKSMKKEKKSKILYKVRKQENDKNREGVKRKERGKWIDE